MQPTVPRRHFLAALGAAAVAGCYSPRDLLARELLYPPIDLSYFDSPISSAPSQIHLGYAAIPWGGNDRQAIDDISSLGFPGIQLRSNCIEEFGTAAAVRDLLQQHKLQMVALSSGGIRIDPAFQSAELDNHLSHAKFTRDAGGLYLQVTDDRPKNRVITAEDYRSLGQLLTELGKRTADIGIPLGYHNHMGSLGERPEEVDQILESADPRYVKLELDIAHYVQGGGDPVKAIEKYSDRLLFLHIKDVVSRPASDKAASSHPYYFVELGRGRVDIPGVFAALNKVNFRGWAVVELDEVADKSVTPLQSAAANKKYLLEKLGLSL